jgi:hypothetical protein
MTFRISQRGKAYLETARTLLHAAQSMTDQAIATRLKSLADDYQRRAERASNVDGKSMGSPAALNVNGIHDLMGRASGASKSPLRSQNRGEIIFVTGR